VEPVAANVSSELHDGVAEVVEGLQESRSAARSRVLDALTADAHRVLLRRWQVLGSVHRIGGSDPGPDALGPAGVIADRALLAAVDRLLRRGSTLVDSDEMADWLRLRRRVQRAGHLLSVFGAFHPYELTAPATSDLWAVDERCAMAEEHLVGARLAATVGLERGGTAALAAGALSDRLHQELPRDIRRLRRRWVRLETSGAVARIAEVAGAGRR
jgi:hypothetical protein